MTPITVVWAILEIIITRLRGGGRRYTVNQLRVKIEKVSFASFFISFQKWFQIFVSYLSYFLDLSWFCLDSVLLWIDLSRFCPIIWLGFHVLVYTLCGGLAECAEHVGNMFFGVCVYILWCVLVGTKVGDGKHVGYNLWCVFCLEF